MTGLGLSTTHNWYSICINNVINFLSTLTLTVDGYIGYKRFLIDWINLCGNKIVDSVRGEVCDDGVNNIISGCTFDCKMKIPIWYLSALNLPATIDPKYQAAAINVIVQYHVYLVNSVIYSLQ